MSDDKGTIVTVNGVAETLIREVVARRSEELGGRVRPQDVTVQFMEMEAAPGCRLFQARWGAGQKEGWLSGLIRDEDAPDTYAGQAMAKIFRRWIETQGRVPDAALAAKVAAYLLDAANRHQVIVSDEDKARLISHDEWLPHVELPEVIETGGQPGIKFWWIGPSGASEMRIQLTEDGRTRTQEKFIRDFLQPE